MKIQTLDLGATSLRAVAFVLFFVFSFSLHVKSDLQFGDFFYWIHPPNICFLLVTGDKKTVKKWGEEYKRRGKEERSAKKKKVK